jgi:hypothetical protein
MGNEEDVANEFKQFGFRFVPIISKKDCQQCSIHILFLRRDAPGNLITNGGDIDNRLKVLFDGLRKPNESHDVAEESPQQGEDPFFCLLEDDSLITEVHVLTDRLLIPCSSEENIHNVELTIHVKTDHDLARASDVRDLQILSAMSG